MLSPPCLNFVVVAPRHETPKTSLLPATDHLPVGTGAYNVTVPYCPVLHRRGGKERLRAMLVELLALWQSLQQFPEYSSAAPAAEALPEELE